MAIINDSFKKLGDYTFDEIGTFSIDQLAGVEFDRQFSPFTNDAKDQSFITWATIATTWASETGTWASFISDMTNDSFKSLGGYTFDEIGTFSLDQVGGVEFDRQFSPITNDDKPV